MNVVNVVNMVQTASLWRACEPAAAPAAGLHLVQDPHRRVRLRASGGRIPWERGPQLAVVGPWSWWNGRHQGGWLSQRYLPTPGGRIPDCCEGSQRM